MAIEQRADDTPFKTPSKASYSSPVPFSDDLAVFWKAADVQSFDICRPQPQQALSGANFS